MPDANPPALTGPSRLLAALVVALLVVLPAFVAAAVLLGHLLGPADSGFGGATTALVIGAVIAAGIAVLMGYYAWRASETVLLWLIAVALVATLGSVTWVLLRLREESAVTLTRPGAVPPPAPAIPPP